MDKKIIRDEKTVTRVKIITVSAIILLFVLIIALLANIISVASLRSRKRSLQKQYDALTAQNTQMQEEIDFRNTDAYLEQYAREVLGMIKDGETVIITK